MNKKAQQNAAAKRARRNTASKQKRADRNARGIKVLPGRRPTHGNEALTALAQALSRSNLDDPLQYILDGSGSLFYQMPKPLTRRNTGFAFS